MTGLQAVYRITKRLETEGFEDAAFEATQMVRQISDRNMFSELSEKQVGRLKEIVLRRLTREPLQYILGEWDFYGLTFKVGPGVLIPRQDTEMLVDLAMRELNLNPYTTAIDLCAGTGCIGISLAKRLPYTHFSFLEKSDEAFKYLEENVKMHLLGAKNVALIKGDLTEEHVGKYSLIVSNPPYIKSAVCNELQTEVKQEPLMALDGGVMAFELKYNFKHRH